MKLKPRRETFCTYFNYEPKIDQAKAKCDTDDGSREAVPCHFDSVSRLRNFLRAGTPTGQLDWALTAAACIHELLGSLTPT